MATKKSATKKVAGSSPVEEKPTAANKAAAKKAPAKVADIKASAPEQAARTPAKEPVQTAKPQPTHHDISVQAYLLWERDGKKHGHHDHYWKQAEHDLKG